VYLEVALCLPKEAVSVAPVRKSVATLLAFFDVHPDCVADIALALSEACANVIKHSTSDDDYEVRLQIDGDTCHLSVKNVGDDLDLSRVDGQMPDPHSENGRGIAIMKALMDKVTLTRESDSDAVVEFSKTLVFLDDNAPRVGRSTSSRH
jgi:serine/threonine-protein kinase RsbW